MFILEKDPKRKTRLRFKTDNKDLDELLRLEFTVPNPGARFSPHAPETLSPITPLGSFQTGLTYDILKFVKRMFPKEKIKVGSEIVSEIKPKFNYTEIKEPNNTTFKLRDYQKASVKLALDNGRGTFELATSAGKSLIIHSIIENIWEAKKSKKQVLILVPTIQLVKQFHGDLIEYGIGEENVDMFSSFAPKLNNAPIIVSNRQYLQNHSDKLPEIDVVITDECLRKGTLIDTPDGKIPIEELNVGDLVLSQNVETKKLEYKEILETHRNLHTSTSYDHFLKIELDSGETIEVTPNHKIYTENRGYVRADELTEDDEIVTHRV